MSAALAMWSKTAMSASDVSHATGFASTVTTDAPVAVAATVDCLEVVGIYEGPVLESGQVVFRKSSSDWSGTLPIGPWPMGTAPAIEQPSCAPGTLFLQASFDGSSWKTLAGGRSEGPAAAHPCLAGTWKYQGVLVSDDHTYKGGTYAFRPVRFTC